MKIKKGDTILVISGKDRLRTGKVLNVFSKEKAVMIEGINLRKKHVRPKRSGEKGQIVQVPSSINISNVKLICQKCGKAVRTGYKTAAGGEPRSSRATRVEAGHGREKARKYRVCKKCGQET